MALMAIVWSVLIGSALIGLFLVSRFLQAMKERHFYVWKSLGSPTLVSNNSVQGNLALFGYLRRREYLGLNDHQFAR